METFIRSVTIILILIALGLFASTMLDDADEYAMETE